MWLTYPKSDVEFAGQQKLGEGTLDEETLVEELQVEWTVERSTNEKGGKGVGSQIYG